MIFSILDSKLNQLSRWCFAFLLLLDRTIGHFYVKVMNYYYSGYMNGDVDF
jgi:hypothetical protein